MPSADVYQLKISLKRLRPEIWRRILIPGDYSFADLHLAVQEAMGWLDIHLHEFKARNPRTDLMELITNKNAVDSWVSLTMPVLRINETEAKISDYFVLKGDTVIYEYDFRDGWLHYITLQRILPAQIGLQYPILLAGKRACPIESCGGVKTYKELLKILNKPSCKNYRDLMEKICMQGYWNFDPNVFTLKSGNLFSRKLVHKKGI